MMRRTDFNCPIESGGSLGTSRGTFAESALRAREVTRCFRWDEARALEGLLDGQPDVYFPFDNSFSESTEGGRLWTPTGAVTFVTNRVRFGGANPLAAVNGIISTAADPVFDLSIAQSWTIRAKISFYVFTTFGPVVTRLVFKGEEDTFGYHGAVSGDVGPISGWTIAVTQTGSASGFSAFRNVDFWLGGENALRVATLPQVQTNTLVGLHMVVVFDHDAQTITSYVNGGLDGQKKTVESIAGKSFTPNEAPLNASSQSSAGFVQTALDELGFWNYPWDEEQVACDLANGYTWP